MLICLVWPIATRWGKHPYIVIKQTYEHAIYVKVAGHAHCVTMATPRGLCSGRRLPIGHIHIFNCTSVFPVNLKSGKNFSNNSPKPLRHIYGQLLHHLWNIVLGLLCAHRLGSTGPIKLRGRGEINDETCPWVGSNQRSRQSIYGSLAPTVGPY